MPDFSGMLRRHDMNLLKLYSIHPADDIEGYRGENVSSVETTLKKQAGQYKDGALGAIQKKLARIIPAFRPKDQMTRNHTIVYREVAKGKTVAWVQLAQRGADKAGNEGAGTVDVTGTYTDKSNTLNWVDTYFLPWDTVGAVIGTTIPARPKDGDPDPDIFFTAAINGCSVFIQGTPKEPTIYHAGGDTQRGTDMERGAAFWREVITNFADLKKGSFQTEVNKTHYIKTPGVQSGGSLTTANAKAYEDWLKDRYKTTLKIQMVNPWGCVFGFRDRNRNWKFYLQENTTVVFVRLDKTAGPEASKLQLVSKPVVVSEIFPANMRGIIQIKHGLPVQVTTS